MCKATPEDKNAPKTTGFALATNKNVANGKTYIVGDPENGAARNTCSKHKVLGDRELALVSSQPLSFNDSEQSLFRENKHMHASQHILAVFRPELPYVDGLNATYECHLALSHRKRGYDSTAAALIEEGISSWHALFYSATLCSDNNPSTPFDNVDIYSIVHRKEKPEIEEGCSLDARYHHLRLASRSKAAFRSETRFKINHAKSYTLASLPMYNIFSVGLALPNLFDVHRDLPLDDSTIEATERHDLLKRAPKVPAADAPVEAEAEVKQESDGTMNEVVWGSDHVIGLRDEVSGVVTFRHEHSAEIYRGIPRAQIVRQGYRLGFVVVSETEGNKRTLAVRDHNLLHAIYNEAAGEEGEEFIPVILPLVGKDMHAIFEPTCSENGDGIVASPLGD
ncbi:hypothetical protein KC332_g8847 [Hortaea werneckii]|uniref:Uncharacterized protein n=1 Tax=Hortaea werneckii TaxID=91943 RepID=A0A3M7IV40_HORWE|nr:hypothetical protein KC358_g8648 [Hortaea werneckii]KAI6827121.1 hypothetical protein KC350_g8369 [Hortaea werneckii]KAI6925174.1 hypothetical protein KC348_g9025 [Hortaea werneckii]KAI6932937.1 hypothetical protein KC341_g8661 [Hortaea werneckii]KAI6967732.1 hypothetical protein KC321_g8857 [Hortaea werneckii]